MNAARTAGWRISLLGLLVVIAPLAGAATRVLIEAEDAQVQMDGDLRCGRDAEITVLARDPTLFEGASARLQSLLDATHALLGFECRNLAGMIVTGRLAGLEATGYQAVAGVANDWLLQPSQTMRVSTSGEVDNQVASSRPAAIHAPPADFVVRNLRRGMPVETALNVVRSGFNSEPRYDAQRNLLSVVDGGCPVAGEFLRRESPLRAGDVCLEATFGDLGTRRLERLTYGQVVDRDQSASIRSTLEARYGQPVHTARPRPATTRLGWGRRLPGTTGLYELEALIEVRENTTELVLLLQGAEPAPRHKVEF